MAIKTLILRADATVTMGTGHVMRCIALAQAWQDAGGAAAFAICEATPAIEKRLRAEEVGIVKVPGPTGGREDTERVIELARRRKADWVVVDGYQFDAEYQRRIRDSGLKLIVVDDYGHARHYSADLVLNQNLHASQDLYREREAHTRILAGPKYALLRREFARWREWTREIPAMASRVLITMGGSDPENVTAKALRAVAAVNLTGMRCDVVVGGSNPHNDALQNLGTKDFVPAVELHYDDVNMAELMARAHVAISAAGSTCWELCMLGLPAVLIDLAENQEPVAESLSRMGVAVHAGSRGKISENKIAFELERVMKSRDLMSAMSAKARELVDGHGCERVLAAMRRGRLELRRAILEDCRQFWEWANEPEVRQVSFASEPIPWKNHVKWFEERLADPRFKLFVALNEANRSVGQVRYEVDGENAVVSISLGREFRGRGMGLELLALANRECTSGTGVRKIDAYVKPDNVASLRLFGSAGFTRQGIAMVRGQEAIRFVLEKSQEAESPKR